MTLESEGPVTVRFSGYSDDTFGAYWDKGDVDHDDCASGIMRIIKVTAQNQRMLVTGIYAPHNVAGTWAIGIAPVEENDLIPDWPMKWSFEKHSAILELEVPDDFKIELVYPA